MKRVSLTVSLISLVIVGATSAGAQNHQKHEPRQQPDSLRQHVTEAEREHARQERRDRNERFKADVRKALAGNGVAGQGRQWGQHGKSWGTPAHGKAWGHH